MAISAVRTAQCALDRKANAQIAMQSPLEAVGNVSATKEAEECRGAR